MPDARLDAALTAFDHWTALEDLAADPPGGRAALAARVGERYEDAAEHERSRLDHLLGLLGQDGDSVVLGLLARGRSDELLSRTFRRRLAVPAPVLDALIERRGYTLEVVDALGLTGDPTRVAELGALLDDPDVCGRAASALARLGAREWALPIARRLPQVTGLAHGAFVVALEQLGDTAVVPLLRDELLDGGERFTGDMHIALTRLTGHDPLIPEDGDVRRAWRELDLATPPVPAVRFGEGGRFTVDEGRGRVRVAYDPPPPGTSWPRWNKSLHVGEHALYRVSSDCGTCETTMTLLGFPPAEARAGAARFRAALADPGDAAAVVAELEPLIAELETGRYAAHLADLALERVAEPEESWWLRRIAVRDDPERWSVELTAWPGVEHFQVPEMIPGAVPTYGSLLPSQPLDALDPAAVARHTSAIARGERPAALVLAWTETRYVEAEFEERFLLGVILDGHHRLAAYAAAGVPARVLLLARTDRDGAVEEVLAALR
ncbi:hypothetical protein AB0I28_35875 [Phytomonospora sp. NPDC050363]|uniref:hypothetical protein n=1 Tax=Phytomonospora sp. NPDC050363 TaxID=3155642 RepID=UPI003405DD25